MLYSNILNQYEISLPRLSSNRANLDLNSAAPSHCCWAAFQASWDTTRLFVLSQGICSTWWMHRNGSRAYCRTPWLKEQHETQASATKSIAFIFIFLFCSQESSENHLNESFRVICCFFFPLYSRTALERIMNWVDLLISAVLLKHSTTLLTQGINPPNNTPWKTSFERRAATRSPSAKKGALLYLSSL